MKWQVGQFLVILGFLLLIVYFMTSQEHSPLYLSFCAGVLVLGLGGYLMWIGRNPPQPSDRFRALRSLSEKRKRSKQGGREGEG